MTLMIKIKDTYNHLGGEEKFPTNLEKDRLKGNIRSWINRGIIKGSDDEVDIESLKEYFVFSSNIKKNYMTISEFSKSLKLNSHLPAYKKALKKMGAECPFDYVVTEHPINSAHFFISKSSVERFLIDYIPVEEIKNSADVIYSNSGWTKLFERLGITPISLGNNQFIKKSEYEIIANETEFNESEYYSLEEYKKILSATPVKDYRAIEIEYDLKPKRIKGRKYYNKEVIDDLKLRQNELREKYMSLQEAEEVAVAEGFSFNSELIKSERVDSLLRPFLKTKKRMFLKENFNNWLEERRNKAKFFNVIMNSSFDTFRYRLEIKEIDIKKVGAFTSETWLHFISSRLKRSKANSETIDITINRYVYCTENLINLLGSTRKREIYSLKSNDINTFINEIPLKNSKIIYLYLKKVHHQLKAKKMETYNFKYVNDPYKFDKESQDKSIYEYEAFKKVYNYAKNIFLHKERAIKDILQEISTGKKAKYLASSWLYVLLHLNNAWRHSDVITFPRVNLSGTQITDLNWLLENELSDEDADYIIKQVYRTEFIISKTQVKNYFFCSEELKKPFATAIAICELRINTLFPLRDSIIEFGNKKKHFSEFLRKNFFGLFDEKEFTFSSRKMNRSLLSYIYVLLSKRLKGSAGLKTIQKMRGHLEQETTNFYVDIPEEELNFLTRQLFARGSFGFIYDTFLDVLQGVEVDREKRTTEIQCLEKFFGNIYKVEEISSFLNVIQSDKKTILDRILSMGLEEALEFVNKIETNQLPSKQDNVQCMVAESGCVKRGQGISCFDCAFSIPNYYALSSLGSSLQDRLNSYLDSEKPESDQPYYEQRKKARLFYIQLDLFAQAIQRFGFDAYEFISYSREEFIENIDKIDSLKNQYQLS